jgi:hypothetical protein
MHVNIDVDVELSFLVEFLVQVLIQTLSTRDHLSQYQIRKF